MFADEEEEVEEDGCVEPENHLAGCCCESGLDDEFEIVISFSVGR